MTLRQVMICDVCLQRISGKEFNAKKGERMIDYGGGAYQSWPGRGELPEQHVCASCCRLLDRARKVLHGLDIDMDMLHQYCGYKNVKGDWKR